MKSLKFVGIVAGIGLGLVFLVSSLKAGPRRGGPPRPEEVTLIGQLVDLQTYMTEKCPSDDFTKCTRDNIRSGVPAAVVTDEDGVIVIGMGDKGPARALIPLAFQDIEIKGKLYDRDGVLYLDMESARVYREDGENPQPPGQDGADAETPEP